MPIPDQDNAAVGSDLKQSMSSSLGIIADDLAKVRRRIDSLLVSDDPAINDMLRHISSRCGKMLRPALVLLVGDALGGVADGHIEVATVIELLHAATLLHDDVLDEAQSRRKAFTPNCLWGNEAAVLLGDFLLGKVFVACSLIEPRQIAQVLSATAIEICSGELTQNTQRQNFQLTEDAYFRIIKAKTAVLFGDCGYLGSLVSGADQRTCRLFHQFGIKVGMAFQITDDLLDVTGDEQQVGKTLGTDLAGSKMTLPLIHMLQHASTRRRDDIVRELTGDMSQTRLLQMLDASGALEYTRSMAQGLCNEAMEVLDMLRDVAQIDRIAEIAKSVAVRCF